MSNSIENLRETIEKTIELEVLENKINKINRNRIRIKKIRNNKKKIKKNLK